MKDDFIDQLIKKSESSDSPLLKLLIAQIKQSEDLSEVKMDKGRAMSDASARTGNPAAAYTG